MFYVRTFSQHLNCVRLVYRLNVGCALTLPSTRKSAKYVRHLNFHILSLSFRLLSHQNKYCVCSVARCANTTLTEHAPLHEHLFSLLYLFFSPSLLFHIIFISVSFSFVVANEYRVFANYVLLKFLYATL